MKTAKEMFEELGYELSNPDGSLVFYSNKDKGHYIGFETKMKIIMTSKPSLWVPINLKELQAINKMVSELGWNE